MKKYGAEAADKISNMNTQQAEKEGESELTKLQKEVCFQCRNSVLLSGLYRSPETYLGHGQHQVGPRHLFSRGWGASLTRTLDCL